MPARPYLESCPPPQRRDDPRRLPRDPVPRRSGRWMHRWALPRGPHGCESHGGGTGCRPERTRQSCRESLAVLLARPRRPMARPRPAATSRLALRDEIRQGPNLRLNPFDLSFQLRSQPLELPLGLEAVDRRPFHRLLSSPDLRPIAGFDLTKPLELPIELLPGNRSNPRAGVTRAEALSERSPPPGDHHI